MNKLQDFHLKAPSKWIWPSLVLFFLFPFVEMNLMALVDGRLYNHVAFPMFTASVWTMLERSWQAGIGHALAQFNSMPFIQITAVDMRSGLKVWALYYPAANVIAHILVSILLAKIIVANKVYLSNLTYKSFLIAVFTIIVPCTYIYLIKHCSGSTWIIETMVLATEDGATIDSYIKNIRPIVFVFQIISTLGGLAALYYYLNHFNRRESQHSDNIRNSDTEGSGID